MVQQHQQLTGDVMPPRRLQDDIRRASVDKGSALLLEQEMKKRSSKNFIIVVYDFFRDKS